MFRRGGNHPINSGLLIVDMSSSTCLHFRRSKLTLHYTPKGSTADASLAGAFESDLKREKKLALRIALITVWLERLYDTLGSDSLRNHGPNDHTTDEDAASVSTKVDNPHKLSLHNNLSCHSKPNVQHINTHGLLCRRKRLSAWVQVKQADPSDLAQLAARWAHTKRVVTPEDTQRSPDRNGQSLATPPRKTNSMTIDYPILGKDFVFAQRCKMCELQSSLRPRKWADWAKRLVLMLRRVHGAQTRDWPVDALGMPLRQVDSASLPQYSQIHTGLHNTLNE
ncbi:hypothetical protein MJO29_010321 [Puccinia striiformis f. sp. tritici]|nr:hypothetical protein MJO29_010321 [Puccinia striiformis f. sp. tritici]